MSAADIPNPSAVIDVSTDSWKFQNSYIERLMDHSALTSAHPDDTLILAGPGRFAHPSVENDVFFEKLLPIGMIQQMQVTQNRPTTLAQAVGSGRSFPLSSKAQGAAMIMRLFVNGRSLCRALYTNAVQAGIDPSVLDDVAAVSRSSKFYANLDSELFLIPFGLAVLFRDKIHNNIGAFYLELCLINSWAVTVGAGQSMIMENVNMVWDRIRPMDGSFMGNPTNPGYTTDFYNPTNPAGSPLYETVFNLSTADANPNLADM